MSLESNKYDIIYGRLLNLELTIDHAKTLAKFLYNISEDLNLTIDQTLRYVSRNGIKFDNQIYASLNKLRTNSSQIGYIDQVAVPSMITQQLPPANNLSTLPNYQITVTPPSATWSIQNIIREITVVPSEATWIVTV